MTDSAKTRFAPTKTKLKIFSKDIYSDSAPDKSADVCVVAQYNPKELQVDRNIPWSKPDASNKTTSKAGGKPGEIRMEFTGAEGRTMQLELLFDGYETGAEAVATNIANLEKLCAVRGSDKTAERRPHQCIVMWGDRVLPKFNCVIVSLSIKYQMFSEDGQPLRATATVKLQEADAVSLKKEK